eukprot:COSAG02_NODE_64_length_43111_cov_35.627709_17_plen_94_part_00
MRGRPLSRIWRTLDSGNGGEGLGAAQAGEHGQQQRERTDPRGCSCGASQGGRHARTPDQRLVGLLSAHAEPGLRVRYTAVKCGPYSSLLARPE